MITGFVAVAMLAVAAVAGASSPWADAMVVFARTTLLKGLAVDANKLPTVDFDDRWSAMFALSETTDTAQRRLNIR
jgi:hypothetical protein